MNIRQNSAFTASLERVGAFLAANLITAGLCMTGIGAPFALVGLFALMNDWVQEKQPEFFRVYFGAIRRHWRVALALGVMDAAGFGLVLFNFSVFMQMSLNDFPAVLSLTMTCCVALILLMANVYAWCIVSLLDLPLRGTIRFSLALALGKPLHSLLITASALLPLLISLTLPAAFFLMVSLALSAYVGARGVWWVLRRQFSREELAELMPAD